MAGRFAGVGFRVEGVPTRWGNQLNGNRSSRRTSLGATWRVPTRWGNQLNGNIILPCGVDRSKAWSSPHSLGKSIEWKL